MKEVVAVDVETGGLDPGEHALLSVGLYHPDEDLEVEMSAQPQKIVTDKALEINGFDRGRVHEGQDLYQAESEVKEFLDGFDKPVFVAHNASYDKAFLTEYFDIQSFEYPFIDTLSVAKLFRQAGMHHPGRLEERPVMVTRESIIRRSTTLKPLMKSMSTSRRRSDRSRETLDPRSCIIDSTLPSPPDAGQIT